MSYQDKNLTCQDCSQSFTFSADDQAFHAERGYTDPKRCPSCRRTRRGERGDMGGGYGSYSREMHPATCAQCGKQTQVPFEPRGGRPVYCSDCFRRQPVSAGRR
ncbi:MAG: zinc-binding protein [Chloroflexi bacterium RBG_16_68_14]|nr:MAG: zinc-binding protein [Chloroflexi bacterium RBG_16_68_14]